MNWHAKQLVGTQLQVICVSIEHQEIGSMNCDPHGCSHPLVLHKNHLSLWLGGPFVVSELR